MTVGAVIENAVAVVGDRVLLFKLLVTTAVPLEKVAVNWTGLADVTVAEVGVPTVATLLIEVIESVPDGSGPTLTTTDWLACAPAALVTVIVYVVVAAGTSWRVCGDEKGPVNWVVTPPTVRETETCAGVSFPLNPMVSWTGLLAVALGALAVMVATGIGATVTVAVAVAAGPASPATVKV